MSHEHWWMEVTTTTDIVEDRARKYICAYCSAEKDEPLSPTGFTRRDVALLREEADMMEIEHYRGTKSEEARRMRNIANNIAALLPPRETE